jgi:hypothetical protein
MPVSLIRFENRIVFERKGKNGLYGGAYMLEKILNHAGGLIYTIAFGIVTIALFTGACFVASPIGAIIIFVLAICAGIVAGKKGRGQENWFIGTMLLPPVLLILLCLGKVPPPPQPMKKCPFCAEQVLLEAKVCKHCGRDLPSSETGGDNETENQQFPDGKKTSSVVSGNKINIRKLIPIMVIVAICVAGLAWYTLGNSKQKILAKDVVERSTPKYTKQQKEAAHKVRQMIFNGRMADIVSTESSVVYLWSDDWNALDHNQQLGMMRTIADAEIVISDGKISTFKIIYKGEVVASATPSEGIKVFKHRTDNQ